MDEYRRLPRRLSADKVVKALLKDQVPKMQTIIDHTRKTTIPGPVTSEGRTLKCCVQVQLWAEADGTESLVVVGTNAVPHLELKALLHDGIYAMAHEGEPGFSHEGTHTPI